MNKLDKEQFYQSWWWLQENHRWSIRNLNIDVVMVDPKTKTVHPKNPSRDTLINYWLETGQMVNSELGDVQEHDIKLDCGGDSFEEAIIKLARLVKRYYGKSSHDIKEIIRK